ncbi:hypothetical protein EV368DRAFT_64266 [Lentinula lateritia]|nr:hypothetical protein EV368DRAFT_64266 [Lentinula lateritia]
MLMQTPVHTALHRHISNFKTLYHSHTPYTLQMVFFPRYLLARLLALCVVLHVAVAIPVVHTSAGTLERRKPTQAVLDQFQTLQIRVVTFDENTEKFVSVNPDLLRDHDKSWLCIGFKCFRGKASPSGLKPEERIMNEKDLGPGLQIGVVSFLSQSQRDEILKSFGTEVIKAKENNLSYIQGMIADLTASWKEGMTLGIDNRPPIVVQLSKQDGIHGRYNSRSGKRRRGNPGGTKGDEQRG